MKDLDKLWALQKLEEEKKIMEENAGIYREKDALEEQMNSYKRLVKAMKDMAEEYKRSEVQLGELEKLFAQADRQIRDGEAHLYEGTENTSKTLYALQEEVQTLADKKAEIGKRIQHLESQHKIDQVNLKRLNKKALDFKDQINEQKKKLKALEQEIQNSMKELTKRTDALRKTIDADSLMEYDRRKERQVPVIVQIENDTCKGCNMHFSLIVGQNIRQHSEDETIICENCGRILYIQED